MVPAPVYSLLAALAAGLLVGNLGALRTITSNEWLHYGLGRLAADAVPAAISTWAGRFALLALAAHLLWLGFRRFGPAEPARRRYCRWLGAGTAIALLVAAGFHLNRYTFKEMWRPRGGIPAAVTSPKVWLANLGVLLAAAAAGYLVFLLLRWWSGPAAALRGRRALGMLGASVGALALPGIGAQAWLLSQDVTGRPNVILISMDTLRADHLGVYGYGPATSPAIDAFAATGVVFEKAVTQANWTLPSHMTLMTSQIASAHGVIVRDNVLPGFKVTLAEILKNAGYRTQAITGGYYVDARFGFDQGFDDYSGDKVEYLLLPEKRKYQKGVRFAHLLPRILDWLEARHDRPYLLFLHAWDTHAPYLPHEHLVEQFSPGYRGSIERFSHEMVDEYQKTWRSAPAEDVARVRALYDNEIRFVDDAVGRILAAVREHGDPANTIVLFTSDYGDELFEHGIDHQWSLYEPETHVPLILVAPGRVPAGKRVTSMVRTIDVLPTLLELTGIEPSPALAGELQGKSLVGTWDGKPPEPWSVAEGYRGRQLSLRTDQFKYLRNDVDGLMREELYDLVRDPGETADLSREQPDRVAAMRQELDDRLLVLRQVRHAGRVETRELDAETIERLRSLGYVD